MSISYRELEKKVENMEHQIQVLSDLVQDLNRKIQGEGTIILSGNRFNVDVSGSLSKYQLKSSS